MSKTPKRITQTESGKAWEYGLARQCADLSKAKLVMDKPCAKAQKSYAMMPGAERRRIDRAAGEVVRFLRAHDERLLKTRRVLIQSDRQGQAGDVRDVLMETDAGAVGISAKHRHAAIKHSRLSDQADFGEEWYGVACSAQYWKAVKPIFADLRKRKDRGELWRDMEVDSKHARYYRPLLRAFMDEIAACPAPAKLMRYLLGRHDFYTVIKQNGDVSVQSFNIAGGLLWGNKLPMPRNVLVCATKPQSLDTAILALDAGWQVSFRLHNAESRIVPSLKFDIKLIGSPHILSAHEIPYN